MAEFTDPTSDREPTDDELEQLEVFCETTEPNEGLPLSAIDGLLAAVACGPGPIQPSEWMATIWDGYPPDFDDLTEARAMLDILMRLHNCVVRQVNLGTYSPMVDVIEEEGDEFEDPVDWCVGFMAGCDLRADTWQKQLAEDPSLSGLLAPIVGLADPSEEVLDLLEADEDRGRMIQRLADCVIDLRDYWRRHA